MKLNLIFLSSVLAAGVVLTSACSTHATLEGQPLVGPAPVKPSPSASPSQTPSSAPISQISPAGAATSLEGTWKVDCRQRVSLSVTFAGNEYVSDMTLFKDGGCTQILQQVSQKGTFKIGAEVNATEHIFAIDKESYNEAGILIQRYDIFQVSESGELRFSARPGQSPETRPTLLKSDLVLRKF